MLLSGITVKPEDDRMTFISYFSFFLTNHQRDVLFCFISRFKMRTIEQSRDNSCRLLYICTDSCLLSFSSMLRPDG